MRVDEGSGKEFRVQWTDEENRLVAERAAAYLRAGVDKTMISAIRRAQEQLLPPKRQRPHMQSRANVPKCAAIIEELLAALSTAPPADTQAEVQAETPPVAAPTEAPTEAPAATPPTPVGELSDQVRLTLHPTANGTNHPPHEPPLGTLSGDADYDDHDRHHEPVEIEDYVPGGRYIPELPPLPSRDQLIDAGAGFIEELFMASAKRILTNPEVGRWLQGFMNRQLPNLVQEDATTKPTKHDPTPISTQKGAVPKVVVCGVKPQHFNRLRDSINGRLQVNFFYDGGGGGGAGLLKLRDKLAGASVALFTIEATSHAHVGIAKQVGVRALRVSGATETMQKALADVATQLGR
jgi:hypothetical protein